MLLLSAALSAQRAQPIAVRQLKPGVYLAEGGSSNSGVVIGQNGVVVIDANGTPEEGKALVAEIGKLTPKPITHVILTHADSDHVDGLAGFPSGITIVAHESAKTQMDAAIAANGRGALGSNPRQWKVITRLGETLTLAGIAVEVRHWAPAHTNGDLMVLLPEARIAFGGDLIPPSSSGPLIQLDKRGSSEGWITASKGMLGFSVQFVPGHGPMKTRTEIQSTLNAVTAKRDRIVSLVKEGKSLEEIRRAVGDPPAAARASVPPAVKGRAPVPVPPTPLTFTEAVHQELTKRQ